MTQVFFWNRGERLSLDWEEKRMQWVQYSAGDDSQRWHEEPVTEVGRHELLKEYRLLHRKDEFPIERLVHLAPDQLLDEIMRAA